MARNSNRRPRQTICCLDQQRFGPNGMAVRFIETAPEDEMVSSSERREGRCCHWPEEEVFFGRWRHAATPSDEPLEVAEEDNEEVLPSVRGKSPMRATVPPTIRRRRPSVGRQNNNRVLHLAHAEA